MEIILDTPKEIEIVAQKKTIADKILINQFTDIGTEVIATITFLNEKDKSLERPMKNITLWTGKAYIDAGQYTDTDVINRIKQLLF